YLGVRRERAGERQVFGHDAAAADFDVLHADDRPAGVVERRVRIELMREVEVDEVDRRADGVAEAIELERVAARVTAAAFPFDDAEETVGVRVEIAVRFLIELGAEQ